MATYAVGDIHGNLDALRDLLDQLALEVRRGDTIVFLGDYVDRGPDTSPIATTTDVVYLKGVRSGAIP